MPISWGLKRRRLRRPDEPPEAGVVSLIGVLSLALCGRRSRVVDPALHGLHALAARESRGRQGRQLATLAPEER